MKLFGNGFDPDKKLDVSKQHKLFIEKHSCPTCTEPKLKVTMLEEGRKGWEAQFFCHGCRTKGILNQTGFRIEFSYIEVKK